MRVWRFERFSDQHVDERLILAISPALFGVVGTVLGARAANASKIEDRHANEDNQARERLAQIRDLLEESSRLREDEQREGMQGRVPSRIHDAETRLARDLVEATSQAQAALITAGIAFDTAVIGVTPIELFAAELDHRSGGGWDRLSASRRAVALLMAYLDRGRRYRGSRLARHRLIQRRDFARKEMRQELDRRLGFDIYEQGFHYWYAPRWARGGEPRIPNYRDTA